MGTGHGCTVRLQSLSRLTRHELEMGMNLKGILNYNDEFQYYQQVDVKTVSVDVIVVIWILEKEEDEKSSEMMVK